MSAHILTATHLDVWLARTGTLHDARWRAECLELLGPEEHQRLETLRDEDSRERYLLMRALIRSTLSRYDRVAPECWQLTANAHGRPELVPGQSRLDLRFNASHTTDLVACAIALGRSVGIDVERHELRVDVVALAERFLAPAEADDVAARPPHEQTARYFRYWTLRESYLKAKGIGLAGSTPAFSFAIAADEEITLAAPDAERWRSWQWQPDAMHTVAVTAELATDEDVHVRIHDVG